MATTITAGLIAQLTKQSYDNYAVRMGKLPANQELTALNGFTRIQAFYDEHSNYYGEAWKSTITNEIIIVNRGTVPGIPDAKADLNIASGKIPEGATVGLAWAQDIKKNFADASTNFVFAGHSLGGYEGQYQNLWFTDEAYRLGENTGRFMAFTEDAPESKGSASQ